MTEVHTTRQHLRFWQVLGRQDVDGELESLAPQQICDTVGHDAPVMRENLATRSAAEWEQCLNETRVPATRVRTVHGAIVSSQLHGRAALQDSGVSTHGESHLKHRSRQSLPANMARPSDPSPRFGEHNKAVVGELGFSIDEIGRFADQGVI